MLHPEKESHTAVFLALYYVFCLCARKVNEYGQGLSILTIILCRWQMSSGHESLNNKNRSSFLLHMLPLETRRRRNAALRVIKIH